MVIKNYSSICVGFIIAFKFSTNYEHRNYLNLKTAPPNSLTHLRKCSVYIDDMRFLKF